MKQRIGILTAVAKELGNGNLDQVVPVQSNDETKQLELLLAARKDSDFCQIGPKYPGQREGVLF